MRTTLLLVLLVCVATPIGAARAADDTRARELYENGALLYEEGDYENAVVAWKEAYNLSERPLLLFNIANALERIGEWQEAHDYLNRYRAWAPAEERDTLDRRMKAIERRLEQSRREDAANQDATTTGGDNELTTTPVGGGAVAARVGPNPGPIVLLGAGLAGVANGGVFTGLAMSARSDAAALCAANGDDILCPDTARQALDNDRTYSLVADISLVAGGVTAAAGLVLAIVDGVQRGSNKKATAIRIIPGASPEGGSVVLVAEF